MVCGIDMWDSKGYVITVARSLWSHNDNLVTRVVMARAKCDSKLTESSLVRVQWIREKYNHGVTRGRSFRLGKAYSARFGGRSYRSVRLLKLPPFLGDGMSLPFKCIGDIADLILLRKLAGDVNVHRK